ncbi:MAG: hypothetical protein DRO76_03060 [Candidatus Altiarchaeales archaeon]|nr:MAG: hypothetical protein DRO76_03060 [Candidatus Altiarchaeales archaeon]HDI73216.1 hydroxyacid dehydrogenase [Candidatus Altiarchaeales archaeon]
MKPRILITDKIHNRAIEEAKKFADVTLDFGISPKDLIKKIPDYDALIVRSATKVTEDVIKAGNLKIIGRAGVGLDNIDVDAAKKRGIKIVNSPEASTISVAELVFGSLIALMRKIIHAHHSMKEGKWERSRFEGNELYGKTLGIVGFGRIGKEVAMRARVFGMNVLAYDPHITEEDCREFNIKYCMELDDLIKDSDVITLHVPLTKETKNLINEERLKLMKESAVLVNIARGGIVNEDSLYRALKENKIKGAVLDVFESEPPEGSPLLSLNNVVLTPHLGASTEEAQINAGMVVVEKIRNFFRDR